MIITDIKKLGRFSKTLIDVKCDICDIDKKIMMKLYTSYGYINSEYLCKKCKLKRNNLEKYGVENVFQLDNVKEKSKKTNLDKYGVEFISQSSITKEKIKKTNLERYGVEHHMKNEEIFNKVKLTNLERYGVDNVSKNEDIMKRKIKTCNSKTKLTESMKKDEFLKIYDCGKIKFELKL